MKVSRFVVVALLAMMLAVVGGGVMAQDGGGTVVSGITMVGGDILTIDPAQAEASTQIEVINQIFIGLTNQDVVTAETGLGIATGFTSEAQDDGSVVFTFTLQEGIPWVRYNADSGAVEQLTDADGNVLTVTAQDVVYGMLRSLNPETASPYSYVLVPYVVGAAEFNAGTGAAEDVGVVAVDDLTVQITAPDAASFAPAIYGLWMARPQPQSVIEEFGDSWTEPENIATNGPFALKEWAHDESITMIRNPFWPGSETVPQAQLDEVTLRFLDAPQQFAEYQAGTMDAIAVPADQLAFVQADPTLSAEYVTGGNPCTYYVGFDNTEGPSANAHFRRALSMSIDRQAIIDNILQGGQEASGFFTYPGLNAAPQQADFPDAMISFDPETAQSEFALALEELGAASAADLGQLSYVFNDTATHTAIAQAIQQMWSETLGLDVILEARESTGYFAGLSEDAPTIYRAGWCQDYSDANNFMYDVFFSASSQNDTGFVNEAYDALVAEARVEADTANRVNLYSQAEQILVNEQAAIAPIYFYNLQLLVKPGVERAPSVTGNEAYYLWSRSS